MGVNGHCRDPLRESLYLSALEVPSQELLTRLAPLVGRVLLVVSISDKHCHHPAEGLWSVCIYMCVCTCLCGLFVGHGRFSWSQGAPFFSFDASL